jgi:predicted DNA-binding transcriptional regulator YafY
MSVFSSKIILTSFGLSQGEGDMRADRLISIIMLLQTRGRVTAREMAAEMEVSERTIYRDIDALSVAGIPVFSEYGPGGGFELLESYRSDLIGLNEHEIRALLMLSIPQPLKELGMGQELKGALLKLSTAIPGNKGETGFQYRQRIHLDSTPWSHSFEQVPFLTTLHQASIQNRLVHIIYRGAFDTEIDAIAAPFGLVAKTSIWYLVFECNARVRVIRIANVSEVSLLEDRFEPREDFLLPSFWETWCKTTEALRPTYPVKLRVSPELFELLRYHHGDLASETEYFENHTDNQVWLKITLSYESIEDARRSILSFGRAAEVIEPISLRMSVIDFAYQIKDLYLRRDALR